MLEKIKATSAFIKEKIPYRPEIAIILGTGLGGLADEIKDQVFLPYDIIPGFPVATIDGHMGRLITGKLGDREVVALQGRFHYYEGYSMEQLVFPIRVMKWMGITHLFVSNASGGLNPLFHIGDIMIINDHINMFPEHPLRGSNIKELGPRFPDMSVAYDSRLINKARMIAFEHDFEVKEGVYVGVQGPTFETPAEYKMFRVLGGDAVGMSTVPEVITACHMGMKVFGISIITDSGVPGQIVEVTHEEVQKVAKQIEPRMTLILKELINKL
jgi:purine-nucleoside phosphorylase